MKHRKGKRTIKLRLWVKIALALILIGLLFLIGKLVYGLFANPITFDGLSYNTRCEERLDDDGEKLLSELAVKLLKAQTNIDNNGTASDYQQEKIDKGVPDLTSMFAKPKGSQALKLQGAMRLLITMRTLSPNDVNVDTGNVEIIINSVEKTSDGFKIEYYENTKLKFHFLDDMVSESYHMPCETHICLVDGQWKISYTYREDDWYTVFLGFYQNYKLDGMSIKEGCNVAFKEARSRFLDNVATLEKEKEEYNNGEAAIAKVLATHPYDRDAAVSYASKYVKKRNTKEFSSYDKYGGNCQNFASQMLLKGGIPMDTKGNAIWKYYGDNYNMTSAKQGRSDSWTTAPYFYKYAKSNRGFGLVAVVDSNMYLAQPGDILQVGLKKGHPTHTNVVIGIAKDFNGKVTDVLVNSNTNNRINWPISAGFMGGCTLIQIIGYND